MSYLTKPPDLRSPADNLVMQFWEKMRPPPKLKVSEWSDQRRVLSPESSAEPGTWDTDRAPYQREVMDVCCDTVTRKIVWQKPSQIGYSECLNNIIGFYIDIDPCPMLIVQPTLAMCQAWSKDRLGPMIRDTPALRDKVSQSKTRDSDNTVLHKKFPGGHITAVGANSPAGLASRPIRIVLLDEPDRYPRSAGAEGNPRLLAEKRQKTFWNRKTFIGGTPTIKNFSEIESEFLESDQRYYHVPCPHCEKEQKLEWCQVKWPEGEPEKAEYICKHCEKDIDHVNKEWMLSKGRWIATKPFKGIAGFFINELYSPWVSWQEMVVEWIKAQESPEALQTFINTSLAETYEDYGEKKDPNLLYQRREEYAAQVPEAVKLLTVAVDVQINRLEYEVVGWGEGKESWGIEAKQLAGDPNEGTVWDSLTKELTKQFIHETRGPMRIDVGVIDSGGQHTQIVYDYCKPENRPLQKFYAIKGKEGEARPIANYRDIFKYPSKKKVLMIGSDTAKSTVYAHLDLKPGPGYCHFPMAYDLEHFEQLASEKVITKYNKGFPTRVWVKLRARNEALDLRAYNHAALIFSGVDLKVVSMELKKKLVERAQQYTPPKPRQNKFIKRPVNNSSWFKRR